MVLITGLGDWILTGGKVIRCTVDRNITCLEEEERGGGGGVVGCQKIKKKKREENSERRKG